MRRVLITGASAGIGRALARALAAPGMTLGLLARRHERLEELAAALRARGAVALPLEADVCMQAATAETIARFAGQAGGLDTVIANAGISRSDRLSEGSPDPGAEVVRVNLLGALHTLLPAIPLLRESGGGHLVAIGSVAGFRGLPDKGAYCASKAALKTMMDAWRPVLRRDGIQVTTICPGWVRTELTARNDYPMPFIMDAERAAGLILRAIRRGRATYVFPWQMRLVVPVMRAVPDWMLTSHAARR